MCGIAGLWDITADGSTSDRAANIRAMTSIQAHRGPDADGFWFDHAAGVALGHRRLSIIDLSPAGAQPMVSADGRYVLTYNGEGYNAQDLRTELEERGHRFRGYSDTEVLVEGFACWGIEETIRRFNGMFAIGVWDRLERRLTLARDRVGIKPLYWYRQGSLILFGSELRVLKAHPRFRADINRDAVASFLRHNYVPGPLSIFQGVEKLRPGTLMCFSAEDVETRTYWDARDVALSGIANRRDISPQEAVGRLDDLLTDAVHRQMVSDVPLGAFLSGGIDSSTVVALMCKKAGSQVRSFSIGFGERDFDESKHAAAVAAHLGTDHTELVVSPSHARELVPTLAEWWDEPFADSSQLPTLLLSKLTRDSVTVALSGDGGDELFAGYNRYFWPERLRPLIGWMPQPLRRCVSAGMKSIPPEVWDRACSLLPAHIRPPQAGDKIHKAAEVLMLEDLALYRRFVSHWSEPERVALGGREFKGELWNDRLTTLFPNPIERMQYLDLVTYLPDDILTKVDRATMAVSLEARVPLLDHRVVEFAWSMPLELKARNGQGKWMLRQVLDRYVPRELIDRPKMGFGVPIGAWLKDPLRDWAESLLDETRLRSAGLVDAKAVRTVWHEHLAGKRNWQYLLWDVLMLEAWRARWAD